MTEAEVPRTQDPADAGDGAARRGELRQRFDQVVAERNALREERRAVLRLLDRLVSEVGPASSSGAEVEALLTDRGGRALEPGRVTPSGLLPVFVAGTGRSGTTATALLLGSHPEIVTAPGELRFHVSWRHGLPGLLAGALSVDDFESALRDLWYRRPTANPALPDAGLCRFMTEQQLDAAITVFRTTFDEHPEKACRDLIEAPIRAFSAVEPAAGWVEHSPENLLVADRLYRLFPEMRLVHVVRDGRDVASSMLSRAYGADDLTEGIRWWGHRLLRGHLHTGGLPAVLVVRFERLAVTERDATLRRLFEFVGHEVTEEVEAHFAGRLLAERVHQGRWRDDVGSEAVGDVDATYRGVLERLRRAGVPIGSFLEDAPTIGEARLEREVLEQELYELRVENRQLLLENLELGAIAAAGDLGGARRDVLAALRTALRSQAAGSENREPEGG